MKIVVLGGDGFCGWPTALHLSARGHEVAIVDNLSRRNIDNELEVEPDADPPDGRAAGGLEGDLRQIVPPYRRGRQLSPSADAASRMEARRRRPLRRAARRAVLDEELVAQALHGQQQRQRHAQPAGRDGREPELDAHVVHLGTMGVYGYGTAGDDDPRGLPAGAASTPTTARTIEQEILYPANPGSVYHMTKTLDQLLFAFYAKNDGAPDHRPAPGHRLGHPDRRDAPRRAADQPLRL